MDCRLSTRICLLLLRDPDAGTWGGSAIGEAGTKDVGGVSEGDTVSPPSTAQCSAPSTTKDHQRIHQDAQHEPRQPPKHSGPTKNDTLTTLVCNVKRSKIRSREAPADLLECHSRSTALVQVRRFASLHIDKTKNMKVVVMGDDGWSESRIRTYSVRTEGGMCRKTPAWTDGFLVSLTPDDCRTKSEGAER